MLCPSRANEDRKSTSVMIRRRLLGKNASFVLLGAIFVITLLMSEWHSFHKFSSEPGSEEIGIFQFHHKLPGFLDVVQLSEYQSNGSATIHEAHVQGFTHMGIWIHIRDR